MVRSSIHLQALGKKSSVDLHTFCFCCLSVSSLCVGPQQCTSRLFSHPFIACRPSRVFDEGVKFLFFFLFPPSFAESSVFATKSEQSHETGRFPADSPGGGGSVVNWVYIKRSEVRMEDQHSAQVKRSDFAESLASRCRKIVVTLN